MKIINKPIYFSNFIWLILNSIFAGCVAGATMGILNFLLEIIRSDSLFGFEDIFGILMWHVLIWFIFGIFMGVIFIVYSVFRKKIIISNLSFLIYLYIFMACWLLIIGYMNIYFLPLLFSFKSIIWNFILLFIGITFFIIILRFLKRLKISKSPIILKFNIFILVIIIFFSFAYNSNFLMMLKKNDKAISDAKFKNFNILIISLDAVRFDHLGCYGYKKKTSPNIDQIAANGVIFENAFAQSSHTIESVPSLFTSTYPTTHNVRHMMNTIPKNLLSLPYIFKLNGYKTSVFSTMTYVSSTYGYKRGVNEFYEPQKNIIRRTILAHSLSKSLLKIFRSRWINNIFKFSYNLFPSKYSLISTDAKYVTQKVISWISENRNKPFFLYVHYEGGHYPYDPPEPYDRLFDTYYPNEPVINCPEPSGLFLPFIKGTPMPKRELENMIAQYDGKIFYHDSNLKFLFNHLKKLNLINKTIVVITADHGEEFYEHKGWAHGHSLFDELIHVPLIFYCPGYIPKGKRIPAFVEQVDVFPTICNLAGVNNKLELPYEIEGVDLSNLFSSRQYRNEREYIFSEFTSADGKNSASCLRTKIFKAIELKYENRIERILLNLISDPLEKNNIYDKESQICNELFERIGTIVKRAKIKAFKPRRMILDENIKEKLRSLGYIK